MAAVGARKPASIATPSTLMLCCAGAAPSARSLPAAEMRARWRTGPASCTSALCTAIIEISYGLCVPPCT
eukprot:1747568-Prymnesium_polylepis.1